MIQIFCVIIIIGEILVYNADEYTQCLMYKQNSIMQKHYVI